MYSIVLYMVSYVGRTPSRADSPIHTKIHTNTKITYVLDQFGYYEMFNHTILHVGIAVGKKIPVPTMA